jgi:hypothetical protein
LDKIRKGKEGRGRLVGAVLGEDLAKTEAEEGSASKKEKEDHSGKSEIQNIVEMDRRVGELEKLVGSSSTTLDEVRSTFILSIYHKDSARFTNAGITSSTSTSSAYHAT